jgi:hypothetical protein
MNDKYGFKFDEENIKKKTRWLLPVFKLIYEMENNPSLKKRNGNEFIEELALLTAINIFKATEKLPPTVTKTDVRDYFISHFIKNLNSMNDLEDNK